ncbi:Zinc finger C2H2-like protein [Macrophomina phaseolina MS6]|uniref:Zinc finger C2H2-like protein n=2 Tax=Macrophomina phaseolina TaxID=35725 RepID=K2RXB2_MACPH|nr:Zinc finger C2H2-like protein [Macrophomina phaseolina MS6]
MLKHQHETSFNCPVINCNRSGCHAFYRMDKLAAHLRAAHEDDDIAKCPCQGCAANLMPLDLLAVHVAEHHWDTESKVIASYAKDMRKCPMPKCRRWVKVCKIAGPDGHLNTEHEEAERITQAPLLWSQGYDAFTCQIICPCCRWRCPDLSALRCHIEELHCADEIMSAEHIMMYGSAVRRMINELPWYMQNLHKDWPVWEKLPYEIKDISFTCPGCAIVFDPSNYWAVDGHAAVMGTPEILYR